jgi:hypothetical protein
MTIPSDADRLAIGSEEIASPPVDVSVHTDPTARAVVDLAAFQRGVKVFEIRACFRRPWLTRVGDDVAATISRRRRLHTLREESVAHGAHRASDLAKISKFE